ncbi:EF-hand calcium-binding domain-containing protein 12 [Nothoprocta perdicaria]|uniref:EF-hand calcium-binding domain-containing protein 12 n=1 Tax=Nothoprocta perdicaria TaxID=30464 RepID=UPI000E1BFD86|nr:EF-hand calcium-binding domain-containing protein 12 [Nothoprocta perdicaria]
MAMDKGMDKGIGTGSYLSRGRVMAMGMDMGMAMGSKSDPPQEAEDSLCFPKITPRAEDDPQKLEAWITERMQFRSQLESLVDVKRWLMQKPSRSDQEERVWRRVQGGRKAGARRPRGAERCLPPGSSQTGCHGSAPLIRAPYPQALVTLQNLLHKHSFKMVDLFRKADVYRGKISREKFIKVIKETKVPVSDKDLEDAIIFLTSSKQGNVIRSEDLVECQDRWLEMMQGQCRETPTGVQAQSPKAAYRTATYRASVGGRAREEKPLVPRKPQARSRLLEVPPGNTEPERRYVSYDEMEEIGKRFRDRKRREKLCLQSKDTPIEWREKCRLVRSGDRRVDEHCLPSTLAGDMAELTDHYRGDSFMTYLRSFNLCKEHQIHLTKAVLQKALLHPGDKIIKEGDDMRKIRQPGGPYSAAAARAPPAASASGPGASGKRAGEMHNRQRRRGRRAGRVSRSHDNNFWPGQLLDKLRLFLPAPPGRALALFSYVGRPGPGCLGGPAAPRPGAGPGRPSAPAQ